LIAPSLVLVRFAIHPSEPHSGAQMLAVITNYPVRWNIAHLALCAAMAWSIPTILGLARLLDEGGKWFALTSSTLIGVGVVFYSAFVGVELAASAAASVSAGRNEMMEQWMGAIVDFKGALPVVRFEWIV
jgi:hypothetical protein